MKLTRKGKVVAAITIICILVALVSWYVLSERKKQAVKTFTIGNNLITVQKLTKNKVSKAQKVNLIEAFDAVASPSPASATATAASPASSLPAAVSTLSTSLMSPSVPAVASQLTTSGPIVSQPVSATSSQLALPGPAVIKQAGPGFAPSVSLVSPSTPTDKSAVTPADTVGAIGVVAKPVAVPEALGQPSLKSGAAQVINPFVCKLSDKSIWYDPTNKFCLQKDKRLYFDPANKVCPVDGKSMFVSSDNRKCNLADRSFYDGTAPQKLRTELEVLEARRREIAQKLNINLDAGVKIGCTNDADCNVLNRDVQGRQNICKSDNTCFCQNGGSGVLCQHPSNFKDTKDMSLQEKQRFRMQNDLSKFTVKDYWNWLMLYTDDVTSLSDDHIANLKRFLAGDTITKAMIPRMRESPPPSAQENLQRLWSVGKVKPDNVVIDAGGPFMPYNYNSFDDFSPPNDINMKVINVDIEKKQNAMQLADQLTPKSDRLLTGKIN